MGELPFSFGEALRLSLASLRPAPNLRYLAALVRWGIETVRAVRRRRRDPRVTIAVDISPFWEPLTGIGWYLYRLLEEVASRTDVAVRLYGPDLVDGQQSGRMAVRLPAGPALEHVSCAPPRSPRVALSVFSTRIARLLGPVLLAADRNRVLFAPNYFPPRRWLLAQATGTPLVVTVHDLSYLKVPWAVRQETLENLETHLDWVWSRASKIVTDSYAVRREILNAGLASPDRVQAVHLAAAQRPDSSSPAPDGTPERYGLFVGTVEPRKNLEVLLDAWTNIQQTCPDPPSLVVCGRLGWKSEHLARRFERAASEGWLRHFGYVSDQELATLYRGALLVALPSHYEGFGLPILEAFEAGVPLVASDIPVFREIAEDAALYAPAGRPDAWEARITDLLGDQNLRKELGRRGRERAARFTWRRSANETVGLLLRVADQA